jgi:hypothetical protein
MSEQRQEYQASPEPAKTVDEVTKAKGRRVKTAERVKVKNLRPTAVFSALGRIPGKSIGWATREEADHNDNLKEVKDG